MESVGPYGLEHAPFAGECSLLQTGPLDTGRGLVPGYWDEQTVLSALVLQGTKTFPWTLVIPEGEYDRLIILAFAARRATNIHSRNQIVARWVRSLRKFRYYPVLEWNGVSIRGTSRPNLNPDIRLVLRMVGPYRRGRRFCFSRP